MNGPERGEAGPKAGPVSSQPDGTAEPAHVQPHDARLSDADLLARVDPIYEAATWYADVSLVDFGYFAELADVLRELRARTAA